MEGLQTKAKLTDERIQQLKALIAKIGTVDPEVYIQGLEEENTRLKARVQTLVNEMTTLEKQHGGIIIIFTFTPTHIYSPFLVKQHYDFTNKLPITPTTTEASASGGEPAPPAAAAVAGGKKKKAPKEGEEYID